MIGKNCISIEIIDKINIQIMTMIMKKYINAGNIKTNKNSQYSQEKLS